MKLPHARGPVSASVTDALRGRGPDVIGAPHDSATLTGEDVQLALWCAYEVGYRGFEDAASDAERCAAVLQWRHRVEDVLEDHLRDLTRPAIEAARAQGNDTTSRLAALVAEGPSSPLVRHLQRNAGRDDLLAFLVERSVYHLKESDPHATALARIDGRSKVALAELLYDEYGAGRPERLHARMYADAMRAAGLDASYGAYLDTVGAATLLSNNVMSLFARQRRLVGALVGHLAAFEATSTDPCRRIAAGIERVGLPAATAAYFHEHVEADAVHEQIVFGDICAAAVCDDWRLEPDILLGAATCLLVDVAASDALYACLVADDAKAVG